VAKVRFGSKTVQLPGSRVARLTIGVLLVLGGIAGFLPILGFWMIPLGFIVLATDFPAIRRFNRRVTVAVSRWWTGRKSKSKPDSATNAG
jgi:hypothetical protein